MNLGGCLGGIGKCVINSFSISISCLGGPDVRSRLIGDGGLCSDYAPISKLVLFCRLKKLDINYSQVLYAYSRAIEVT